MLIDDDLSVCGVDCRIDYELRLVADINMSIHSELHAQQDSAVAKMLEDWFTPIFTSLNNEVDLSFFSTDGADELREHRTEQTTARRHSFTFYLPREDYRHLAAVNVTGDNGLALRGASHAATIRVETEKKDTLPSHRTAIYTARYPIVLDDRESQSFEVNLYVASSGVALVLDSIALRMPKIEVLLSGTSSGMTLNDSTFLFDRNTLIRAEQLTKQCYAAVSLPSRDRMKLSPSAFPNKVEANALWELIVHVTQPTGKITETILHVDDPLEAGDIKIIKCKVEYDGSLVPVATTDVGATVTLDWKEGSEHEIEI